ncbi:LptE family protein [Pedobacter sp.]|uniref:LptE family protein n=1 Tax=Pedobacter sp. TaxID=1411316 RepID=UPI003D7F7D12
MKRTVVLVLLVIVATFNSCTIKFNGASIPPEMKTINVDFFENNAQLVVPTLSQQFTEELKNRIRTQTRLNLTQGDADAKLEGRITGYDIRQLTLTDNERLTEGSSRLTITVTAKYTNNLDPKQSFEESFSSFKNFSLTGRSLQSIEPQLIKEINVMITENIFNRAFAQW